VGATTKFKRKDWMAVAGLFILSLGLRIPFRSALAYHWDSAQFALAIREYNVALSQPHAPGYFLYVMLGRLVNVFVGDPHASLVWISVVAGAMLAALGFLLGTAMFGRGCGLAAGAILATSPLCWFHSEVALTNIVDSMLVTATVLACLLAIRRGGTWSDVTALSLLFAATAGVRQQSAPMLLPVWLYAFSRFPAPRWPKFVAGVTLTALLCVAWFVPMVEMSGGIRAYWQALLAKAQFDAPKTPWCGGFAALGNDVRMIVDVCWVGLLGAAVFAGGELLRFVLLQRREVRCQFYTRHSEQLRLLALWLFPMLAFNMATYMTMPGYVLNYFPCLAILAGLAVWKFTVRPATQFGNLAAGALTLLGVVVLNGFVFMMQPGWGNRLLKGLPLTARQLNEHDQRLLEMFAIIRARYRPDEVLICHEAQFFYWGFRHFQYYLPEYRNVLLATDGSLPGERGRRFWVGYLLRTEFIKPQEVPTALTAVLVVPPGLDLKTFATFFDVSKARPVKDSGDLLYFVSLKNW
jgi:hypothetical protein